MDINQTNSQTITYNCPKCGASNIPADSLTGYDKTLCPYCGHELIDLTLQKHAARVNEVVTKKKKLRKTPLIVSLVIAGTLLVLFLILAGIYVFNLDSKGQTAYYSIGPSYYTSKMEKAYKNEDWDELFDIVILKCEKSINSSWYFAYRTAWFMHEYPSRFDEAIASGDETAARDIFRTIRADYLLRDDFFDTMYDSIPEVEEQLKKEYAREKAIIEEL